MRVLPIHFLLVDKKGFDQNRFRQNDLILRGFVSIGCVLIYLGLMACYFEKSLLVYRRVLIQHLLGNCELRTWWQALK